MRLPAWLPGILLGAQPIELRLHCIYAACRLPTMVSCHPGVALIAGGEMQAIGG